MLFEILPWLIAMGLLIAGSAFFSASEAALFSLRQKDVRMLARGSHAQRLAAQLLEDPDRLLSAVLFWNLVINMAYFAMASIVGMSLEKSPAWGASANYAFAGGALLTIIFCSEMLPKSVAGSAGRTSWRDRRHGLPCKWRAPSRRVERRWMFKMISRFLSAKR